MQFITKSGFKSRGGYNGACTVNSKVTDKTGPDKLTKIIYLQF